MSDTEFDVREAAEAAAEAAERIDRHYQQRISDLEYGIDGSLDMLDSLAERADDADFAESVRAIRRFLDGYRNPQ